MRTMHSILVVAVVATFTASATADPSIQPQVIRKAAPSPNAPVLYWHPRPKLYPQMQARPSVSDEAVPKMGFGLSDADAAVSSGRAVSAKIDAAKERVRHVLEQEVALKAQQVSVESQLSDALSTVEAVQSQNAEVVRRAAASAEEMKREKALMESNLARSEANVQAKLQQGEQLLDEKKTALKAEAVQTEHRLQAQKQLLLDKMNQLKQEQAEARNMLKLAQEEHQASLQKAEETMQAAKQEHMMADQELEQAHRESEQAKQEEAAVERRLEQALNTTDRLRERDANLQARAIRMQEGGQAALRRAAQLQKEADAAEASKKEAEAKLKEEESEMADMKAELRKMKEEVKEEHSRSVAELDKASSIKADAEKQIKSAQEAEQAARKEEVKTVAEMEEMKTKLTEQALKSKQEEEKKEEDLRQQLHVTETKIQEMKNNLDRDHTTADKSKNDVDQLTKKLHLLEQLALKQRATMKEKLMEAKVAAKEGVLKAKGDAQHELADVKKQSEEQVMKMEHKLLEEQKGLHQKEEVVEQTKKMLDMLAQQHNSLDARQQQAAAMLHEQHDREQNILAQAQATVQAQAQLQGEREKMMQLQQGNGGEVDRMQELYKKIVSETSNRPPVAQPAMPQMPPQQLGSYEPEPQPQWTPPPQWQQPAPQYQQPPPQYQQPEPTGAPAAASDGKDFYSDVSSAIHSSSDSFYSDIVETPAAAPAGHGGRPVADAGVATVAGLPPLPAKQEVETASAAAGDDDKDDQPQPEMLQQKEDQEGDEEDDSGGEESAEPQMLPPSDAKANATKPTPAPDTQDTTGSLETETVGAVDADGNLELEGPPEDDADSSAPDTPAAANTTAASQPAVQPQEQAQGGGAAWFPGAEAPTTPAVVPSAVEFTPQPPPAFAPPAFYPATTPPAGHSAAPVVVGNPVTVANVPTVQGHYVPSFDPMHNPVLDAKDAEIAALKDAQIAALKAQLAQMQPPAEIPHDQVVALNDHLRDPTSPMKVAPQLEAQVPQETATPEQVAMTPPPHFEVIEQATSSATAGATNGATDRDVSTVFDVDHVPRKHHRSSGEAASSSGKAQSGSRPSAPQAQQSDVAAPKYSCMRLCSGGYPEDYRDGKLSADWIISGKAEEMRSKIMKNPKFANGDCIRWCVPGSK